MRMFPELALSSTTADSPGCSWTLTPVSVPTVVDLLTVLLLPQSCSKPNFVSPPPPVPRKPTSYLIDCSNLILLLFDHVLLTVLVTCSEILVVNVVGKSLLFVRVLDAKMAGLLVISRICALTGRSTLCTCSHP